MELEGPAVERALQQEEPKDLPGVLKILEALKNKEIPSRNESIEGRRENVSKALISAALSGGSPRHLEK